MNEKIEQIRVLLDQLESDSGDAEALQFSKKQQRLRVAEHCYSNC